MPPSSSSEESDRSGLILGLEDLLDRFDYTDVTCISPGGAWGKSPASLRDRISNELIFRLWQARQRGDWPAAAGHLIAALPAGPDAWGMAEVSFVREPVPAVCSPNLLAVLETVFALAEYMVYLTNSCAYAAEWDFKGKARKRFNEERAGEVLERLVRASGLPDDRWVEIGSSLLDAEESVFGKAVATVAEEEAIRWGAGGWFAPAGDAGEDGNISQVPVEGSGPDIHLFASTGDALLRPCIELLQRKDISVDSGIQYEASRLLGRIRDPRSLGGLLRSLDSIAPGHTGIRANLVYALGNLEEKRCLRRFMEVLESADSVAVELPGGGAYSESLHAVKCEAIWALGKLGADAAEAISRLVASMETSDLHIRLHLAWALSAVGLGQKRRTGATDPAVPAALMRLVRQGGCTLFEEAAYGLKEMGLVEFAQDLRPHDFNTLPVLSLKPSITGLYELSETILHTVSVKRPVVMAVTGDSGTGKTYFCEAILGGFGGIGSSEILYLKRDRTGDRTLDRIVGFKWLRSHVEPRFYDPYPVLESRDDSDAYFDEFIRANRNKKLIILDGWRDRAYFNRVIEVFNQKGYLDLLVHFRTTFSTRRLNLEEREASLDLVKIHLPLVEEPLIEETTFYREGSVLVYSLDNSIPSRLDSDGIREVFNRRKADRWTEKIRIGRFTTDRRHAGVEPMVLVPAEEQIRPRREALRTGGPKSLKIHESNFTRKLNDSLEARPHLLETVTTGNIPIHRIVFNTQGQIAFCGYDGTVGVLIGFSDEIYYAKPHASLVRGVTVRGRDLCTIGDDGFLKMVSFEKKTVMELGPLDPPATALGGNREGRLATGHDDGIVRVWDLEPGQVTVLPLHDGPVESIAVDRTGQVYSGGRDGRVRILNSDLSSVITVTIPRASAAVLAPCGGGLLAVSAVHEMQAGDCPEPAEFLILDPAGGRGRALSIAEARSMSAINVYFDGRLMFAFNSDGDAGLQGGIAVLTPGAQIPSYVVLGGHAAEARDCITMGPRIISCGSESEAEHTLKIWGTESYVASEHARARLMPESMPRPPYYRSIF